MTINLMGRFGQLSDLIESPFIALLPRHRHRQSTSNKPFSDLSVSTKSVLRTIRHENPVVSTVRLEPLPSFQRPVTLGRVAFLRGIAQPAYAAIPPAVRYAGLVVGTAPSVSSVGSLGISN
jgi:hypothetical protein